MPEKGLLPSMQALPVGLIHREDFLVQKRMEKSCHSGSESENTGEAVEGWRGE